MMVQKIDQKPNLQQLSDFFNDYDGYRGRKYLKWELEDIFGLDQFSCNTVCQTLSMEADKSAVTIEQLIDSIASSTPKYQKGMLRNETIYAAPAPEAFKLIATAAIDMYETY